MPVVRNLSFTIEPGMILGLLGPNGAGKTTTLRMILDILRPDEGQVSFDEKRINRKTRNRIGYLPEERGIYQKYKVIDVLLYFARLKNLSKKKSQVEAVRLLDRFELIDYLEEPVFHLSKGMQQKLQFVMCLIHNPDYLIMDEPFWGLDPMNQEMARQKLRDLKEEGKIVLLSTHQLNEAEALCDYFVLLDTGEVVLEGNLDSIRKRFHNNIIMVEAKQNLSILREIANIQKVVVENSRASLYVDENTPVNHILREIIQTLDVTRIELKQPALNDIFLQTISNRKQGAK